MDEQLSIGDASFSEENSPVLEVFQLNLIIKDKSDRSISTLSEFYNETGILFMDNILTSFRRESNAFAIDSSNFFHI